MTNYLSEQEIVDIFFDYLDNSIYNYAIMLDGSWGSGKTFFVKEQLIPQIQEREERLQERNKEYQKYKVLYVSLYGITSTSEISRLIYMEMHRMSVPAKNCEQSSRTKKIFDVVNVGAKIMADIVKDVSNVDLFSTLDDLDTLVSLNQYILVFDDLERANCNINEILGYINNFVEHDGIKVLLVANEKEINMSARLQKKPDEMLLCLNDGLDFGETEDSRKDRSGTVPINKITVDKLMNRVDKLFTCNQEYNQIKEKLVGITIQYHPDYDNLIQLLIEQQLQDKDELRTVLLEKRERMLEIIHHYRHYNLRTFLFFLSKCMELESCFENHTDIFERSLDYFFTICVQFKMGLDIQQWDDEVQYGSRPLFDRLDFRNYALGFRFMDDFVQFGRLNRTEAGNMVEEYVAYEAQNARLQDDPLNKINEWSTMQETEVRGYLEEILQNLRDDKYNIDLYPRILNRIVNLVEIGFEQEYLDKAFNYMQHNIEGMKELYSLHGNVSTFIDDAGRELYINKMNELNDFIQSQQTKKKDKYLNEVIKDSRNWGEQLSQYVAYRSNDSLENRQIIDRLDVDLILQNIDRGDSRNIEMFRYAISDVYSFSNISDYYKSDYDNLVALYEGMDPEKEQYDLIKRTNVRMLKELIQSKLELLKEE